MPYLDPSDTALETAFQEIADRAEAEAASALDVRDAIDRLETILTEGNRRLGAAFIAHNSSPWPPEALDNLRVIAAGYAADTLRGLRTCVATGAVLSTPVPTRGSLVALTQQYAGASESMMVEFAGAHPDQVLVEQFAGPVTEPAVPFLGPGSGSEDELVRASYGVIRAAARLMAAIDERPELSSEFA